MSLEIMEFISHSVGETQKFGAKLAAILQPGDVVALEGELGAGKTCFIQGLARGLGVREKYVASPSFVLIREYKGRFPFYHVDLYRLTPGMEVAGLGLDEYLEGEGVTAIEWAEKAQRLLPPHSIRIMMKFLNETERKIIVRGLDEERMKRMTKSETRMTKE